LSRDELAQYARTGWVACKGLFSPREVADISRWTDELAAMPEAPGRHMVYYEDSLLEPGTRVVQRIEDFCPYHRGFDALVRSGAIVAAVEQLFEAPAVLFKEKINFKKAGGAGFEPHQDQQAGWSSYAPLFITALVSIDRATPQNGCLEMPRASRVLGLIGEDWTPLTPDQIRDQDLTPVPSEPGDVLFFDSYVPHGSKANLTDAQRRILYLTYNRADAGDHRRRYYDEKRANFPPDIERQAGRTYRFRV
jgi:ectoine hydroxylase-related dioxygenase (phytanoyl-CoA dioxygenase family)